ncbi:MAG: Mn2+-dependent serine/threonine protein kinase [Planctomycetaceae bacterium]|nr:Mn2+-dependent serine/threonine protein kinase [Planctomycetaceae bacterium]
MPAHSVELLPPCVITEVRAPQPSALTERPVPELIRVLDGRTRGLGLARLGADCLRRLASAPELLLAGAREWLKDQPGHRVALVESESNTAPGMWCCKETVTRDWWVRFVTTWGSFRAHNAFRQGLALLRANVSTPQPLAVLTVTRGGAYHEYLLTEAVPGTSSLHSWLTSCAPARSTEELLRRREITRQLGLQLQRLHGRGFDHRDLKSTNILISEQAASPSVWLIDLDGVWRWPWLPGPRRVQNLARLWAGVAAIPGVTTTDALRLLFAYLTPEQRRGWKSLWCRVARRSAAKIAKQRT